MALQSAITEEILILIKLKTFDKDTVDVDLTK